MRVCAPHVGEAGVRVNFKVSSGYSALIVGGYSAKLWVRDYNIL